MAHTERDQPTTTTSQATGEPQGDEKYDINQRFFQIVDGEYNAEEEKMLDQKYDSLWQPSWMGHDRKWRIITRTFICGLAIALIWLTSLKLATTIASLYVASPTYQEALHQWEQSIDLTRAERVTSEACATRQMIVCDRILGEKIAELVDRSSSALTSNLDQLDQQNVLVQLCTTNWENTIVTTSKFLQQSLDLTNIYKSYGNGSYYCSTEEISALSNLLSDATQEKNDVYLVNVDYSRQSTSLVDNAADQIANRAAYDQSYVENKTDMAIDMKVSVGNLGNLHSADLKAALGDLDAPLTTMIDCIQLKEGSSCPSPNGAMTWFNGVKLDVENAVGDIEADFNENLYLTTNYINDAIEWKDRAIEIIQSVEQWVSDVQATLDLSVFDLSTFYVGFPSPPEFSDFNAPSPLVRLPGNLSVPFVNSFNQTFGNWKRDMGNLGTYWKNDINIAVAPLPTMFNDYNPPNITLDNVSWHETSDNFLTSSKQSLGEIGNEVSINETAYNASEFYSDLKAGLVFSPFALLTEEFTGQVDVYDAFGSLGTILFLLITADVIWRVWQTVSFLRKYKRMSEIGVPEIDARQFEADKATANPTLQTYKLLTSPWVILLTMGVIAFLVLIALISIYIPLYESYISGCTQSTNGTLLTHNSYSFAYNYAATPYNDVIAHGLRVYDQNRTEKCDVKQKDYETYQKNVEYAWGNNVFKYDQKQPDLALYQKCVDPTKLPNDTEFQRVLGRRSPYADVVADIRQNNCSAPGMYGNTTGLQNGLLNCSALPVCHLTCTGPDKLALAASTYDSGCTSEWMFHAGLFRFLVALLIYVSLNISRTLLMTAIIRLAWRTLSTNGFEFRGTCTKLGQIEGFEDRLKTELDKSVKSYERGALLMLIFAVLVHIPYIVVLTRYGDVLSQDAQFDDGL